MSALTLSEIWIYPVKSLGGLRVKKSQVLGKGLQYDRRYMLADENNQFITQRYMPRMSLFKLSLNHDAFSVSHQSDSIEIPFISSEDEPRSTFRIWEDEVQACEVGKEFNEWFSDRLQMKCKLVYFPEDSTRLVDKNYAPKNEQVSLADGYPFLIIGQQSLNDLNERLKAPVPINRFRPNFVFAGGQPYEEDNWKDFTIGANRFKGLKQCARCVLTTVDQDTGVQGTEPLATLSAYRKNGSRVNFGQNLVAIDRKEVKEGDSITIQSFQ